MTPLITAPGDTRASDATEHKKVNHQKSKLINFFTHFCLFAYILSFPQLYFEYSGK